MTRAADDFAAIRARMKELEQERSRARREDTIPHAPWPHAVSISVVGGSRRVRAISDLMRAVAQRRRTAGSYGP